MAYGFPQNGLRYARIPMPPISVIALADHPMVPTDLPDFVPVFAVAVAVILVARLLRR